MLHLHIFCAALQQSLGRAAPANARSRALERPAGMAAGVYGFVYGAPGRASRFQSSACLRFLARVRLLRNSRRIVRQIGTFCSASSLIACSGCWAVPTT